MGHRALAALLVLVTVMTCSSVLVAGQSNLVAGEPWSPPRTSWGAPDLQGTWTNTTTTPLQRPDAFAGRERLTDEERVELDAREAAAHANHKPPPGSTGTYNRFWMDQGSRTSQTSLIVDPTTGRLPSLTPQAQQRVDRLALLRNSLSYPAMWDEPSVFERCITRGMPAMMMPGFNNHYYHIIQTPTYVVLRVEMVHDVRIIPLDGREHLAPTVRQWLGDSRGHWEGNTLVVETTNFTDKVSERRPTLAVYGASDAMKVVERFTRVDADTIDYRFTVTDPTTFTQPWTASIPMRLVDAPLFEYACHEGNYSIPNMLRGAREQERSTR